MNPKPWWKSKTVWFNVLSAAVLVAGGQVGIHIPPNVATPILIGGNLALRVITGQPIAVPGAPQ